MTKLKKLTAAQIPHLPEGRHSYGNSLYLQVVRDSRIWVYRYKILGTNKGVEYSIGPYSKQLGLTEARKERDRLVQLRRGGTDPKAARLEAQKNRITQAGLNALTFRKCVLEYAEGRRWAAGFEAWELHLRNHVYGDESDPTAFGNTPVGKIDKAAVLRVLDPIWKKGKIDLLGRIRTQIATILDYAKGRGYRSGDNPAEWKGGLDAVYERTEKAALRKNHAAVAYTDIAGVMQQLAAFTAKANSVVGRAVQFIVLTACRTDEALDARWDEIDFAAGVWNVPAPNMKTRLPHRVPLCSQAIALLEEMRTLRTNGYIFPGASDGRLGESSCLNLLKKMGFKITVHGMRATFRTWAHKTTYSRDLIEECLAHTVGNAVERAYIRDDQLEKRVPIMADWGNYCTTMPASDNVVQLRQVG